MAQEEKPSATVDYVALNYTVRIKAADGSLQDFSDQVQLNFNNEAELAMTLSEKPYLAAVIEPIVKRIKDGYDPGNTVAKKLKASLAL